VSLLLGDFPLRGVLVPPGVLVPGVLPLGVFSF